MQRDGQNAGVFVEDFLGTVTVMRIPINHRNAGQLVPLLHRANGNGSIGKEAEAHAFRGTGVMSGRTHHRPAGGGLPPVQPLDQVEPGTGRPAGGLMWAGLANSFYWIDLTNDIAGCYISQIVPFADARSYQLYHDVETAVYRNLASIS